MSVILAITIGLLVVSIGLNVFLFMVSYAFWDKITKLEKQEDNK